VFEHVKGFSESELWKEIEYHEYRWNVFADLKVMSVLTGLQGGYTKF
jgi:hypothetical protein